MENARGYLIIGAIMIAAFGWFFLRSDPKTAKRHSDFGLMDLVQGEDRESESPEDLAKESIEKLTIMVMIYLDAHDGPPDDLASLAGKKHPGTKMTYLDEDQLVDPWEQPYRIEQTTARGAENLPFQIVSDGPDRISGTQDDIHSDKIDPLVLALLRGYMNQ